MALAAKLQLRQSQSLVMTPQLMQSIRLLQFTHAELERFIDEEIERNPLLERSADPDGEPAGEAPEPESTSSDWFEHELDSSADSMSAKLDAPLDNVFPDDPGPAEPLGPDLASMWKSAASGSAPVDGIDFDAIAAAPPTLRDHLAEQIAFALPERMAAAVAWDLADHLDESGYFRGDLDEVAERLSVSRRTVDRVFAACRRLDPPGIFAQNLADCLALQLAARNRLDPAMQAMLDHLDLLARRDFQSLRRICGVEEDDLLDMLAEIRKLDPKPGAGFVGGHADTIVPDVMVRQAPDGGWTVELNAETLPRVLVDQIYYTRIAASTRDDADRSFLSDCLQNANWLTRSLDQRARTILKVTTEIVRQQDAFLVHGIRHLRPLNLRMVAEAIGMHESTVSRVTSNKYVATPRGVFELRFFFTAALAAVSGGESHSSGAVRDRIRQMIEEERPSDVLSDDSIVEVLRRDGIDIARRTVAKYRESMNIASSVQRRREKRALERVAG